MIKKPITEISTAEEAEQIAIDWQQWQGGQNLYMSEVSEWQNYFESVAEKFNLTDVFKENGII